MEKPRQTLSKRHTHSTKPLIHLTRPGLPSLIADRATASIEIRLSDTWRARPPLSGVLKMVPLNLEQLCLTFLAAVFALLIVPKLLIKPQKTVKL